MTDNVMKLNVIVLAFLLTTGARSDDCSNFNSSGCLESCAACHGQGPWIPSCHPCSGGGYRCICQPGYMLWKIGEGEGCTCTDINECRDHNLHNCSEFAKCVNTRGSFNCNCLDGYKGNGTICTAILPPSSTFIVPTHTLPSHMTTTPTFETSLKFHVSAGSITGGVIGLLVFFVMVAIFIILLVLTVLKISKRTTETLEPWPTAHRNGDGLHNPTYAVQDFPPLPPLPPTPIPSPSYLSTSSCPPEYEEVKATSCSDLQSDSGRHFENPLYTDVTYSPAEDTASYSLVTESDCPSTLYAKATSPGCSSGDRCTQDSEEYQDLSVEPCNSQLDNSSKEVHSYEMCNLKDDPTDYSTLDPTSQYAILEPFIGPSQPKAAQQTVIDPALDDYSHLEH